MEKAQIAYLFQRYLKNTATADELQELEQLVRNPLHEAILKELIDKSYFQNYNSYPQVIVDPAVKEKSFQYITTQKQYKKTLKLWPRFAAAASILVLLTVGSYFLFVDKPTTQIAKKAPNDIAPGGNKAILTLSDGEEIVLNQAKNGTLAKEGNTLINKNNEGSITYNKENTNSTGNLRAKIQYNTITIPRGGTYQLTLPDGTKVWLNAMSQLKFPTTFIGKERRVELIGEAYFEVSSNKEKPFIVKAAEQTIQVLGTHFNVNAYKDENVIKTDLLEGKVKIQVGKENAFLEPGQASFVASNNNIMVQNADVAAAIAWKNGLFSFKRADLKTVMRQISRWYDVEVAYEGAVPDAAITGTVDRNLSASKVLDIILSLGFSFEIEGKKITIKSNNP